MTLGEHHGCVAMVDFPWKDDLIKVSRTHALCSSVAVPQNRGMAGNSDQQDLQLSDMGRLVRSVKRDW